MSSAVKVKSMLPELCLIGATTFWASSFIASKIAFRAYDPMVVVFSRMFIGSICFLLMSFRYKLTFSYRKGDHKLLLFMAFCEPCLYFLFEAQAIVHTTASQAGMITAILPVFVMIVAGFLLKERTGRKGWSGALIALAGVIWLTLESSPQENAPNPMLGNFLEVLAMMCAAGYMIAVRMLTSRYSPLFLTAVQAFAGCIFFFPFLLFPRTELPTEFVFTSAAAVCYLGTVVTIGAFGLYNHGLKHVPVSRASSYVNLIPVFSVMLGWIILGETLSGYQILAAAVVMLGVWLTQQRERQRQETA